MKNFDLENFKKINAIIERDSKDATYKFALLRGAIEISQEYSHLKSESGNRVSFPLGLLVEKWLLYYYPLIESSEFIPQKHGETETSTLKMSFRDTFKKVTDFYADKGGLSVFFNDYWNGKIPKEISPAVLALALKLKTTITTMPMRHLGYSISRNEYSVFRYDGGASRLSGSGEISQDMLVKKFGTFSFPMELFAVFQYLGSFISGEDSLLYQWAEFTVNSEKSGNLTIESVLQKLRTYPETERAVSDAKIVYHQMFCEDQSIDCVWSGKKIKTFESVHIDHLIPFTIWKNNDLWNLLPASGDVNNKKRDKIPAPDFVDERSDSICRYWDILHNAYQPRFDREASLSLIGTVPIRSDWHEIALENVKAKCEYLIDVRGFDEWRL